MAACLVTRALHMKEEENYERIVTNSELKTLLLFTFLVIKDSVFHIHSFKA